MSEVPLYLGGSDAADDGLAGGGSSLELSDTQSLCALNTSPPRNRCTFRSAAGRYLGGSDAADDGLAGGGGGGGGAGGGGRCEHCAAQVLSAHVKQSRPDSGRGSDSGLGFQVQGLETF